MQKRNTLIIWLITGFLPFNLFGYSLKLKFQSSGYHFNNADQLEYNQSTYENNQPVDRLNSDDRLSILASGVQLDFHQRYKFSEFFATVRQSGAWGSDSLEGTPEKGNTLTYNQLYFTYYLNRDMSYSLGRFRFTLEDTANEYFFNDTVDGFEWRHDLFLGISYRALFDVLGVAAKPENTRVWFSLSKDEESIDDFQGDVVTMRAGLVLDHELFSMFDNPFKYKIFSFYLRYGANTQGGADIAENGKSSLNAADNDFLWNSGVRISYDLNGYWITDFTFSYSKGADNQFNSVKKYDDVAAAWNQRFDLTPLEWPLDLLIDLSAGYFGPKFAGMKANSPGGLLLTAYKGYFLSPYAYFYHFRDNAKRSFEIGAVDKTVSKSFAKIGFSTYIGGLLPSVSALVLFANEGTNDGARTFGEQNVYMGMEIESSIRYNVDNIDFVFFYSMFMPGKYYEKRKAENVYLPQGTEPMTGLGLTVDYKLEF